MNDNHAQVRSRLRGGTRAAEGSALLASLLGLSGAAWLLTARFARAGMSEGILTRPNPHGRRIPEGSPKVTRGTILTKIWHLRLEGAPMTAADVLVDAFGRIREIVHEVVDLRKPSELLYRPDSAANSICWLVWHLTRIQDDHVAGAAGTEQVWTSKGWFERFGLPLDACATGYGHGTQDVAAVQVKSGELLTGYHDAVYQETISYVQGLADADLDRIVDASWNPPVTLGIRLISVISDDLQHAGQAAYILGLANRLAP